jgi:hypothetical protein
MRITILLFSLITVFLFSCQKEVNWITTGNNSGGGSNTTGILLTKMVLKTGLDSMVYTYGYNASKKIISMKQEGIDDQGDDVNNEYHYHRNASGMVTDYSIISPDLVFYGIDSITVIVHSNSSRYTSYVINVNIPGYILLDSSSFVYNSSGKIIGEDLYESPSGDGSDYYLAEKVNYSYTTRGDLSSLEIHDFDQSGTETFTASTFNINYDSKVNPIYAGNEGFALGQLSWVSPNNVVSQQLQDSNGSVDDQSVTFTYTYNNNDRPQTCVINVMPDNTVTNISYYYQ